MQSACRWGRRYTKAMSEVMSDEVELEPPCHRCIARCCWQQHSGWPFAVMLEPEDGDKFDAVAVYHPDAPGKVIPYNENGCCPFLTEDNRCGVHDDKPRTCRAFNCTTGHIVFLSRNPELLALLEEIDSGQ